MRYEGVPTRRTPAAGSAHDGNGVRLRDGDPGSKEHLVIEQLPIVYHPREGESKLSSFRDGWRHLRFLLVHSPTYLFVLPGLFLFVVGVILSLIVLARVSVLGRTWEMHTLIGGSLLEIIGTQVIGLGLCAHAYGTYFMSEHERWFTAARSRLQLEHGLIVGGAVTLVGLIFGAVVVIHWIGNGLGALGNEMMALVSATLLIIGVQIVFTSFLLSTLGLRRDDDAARADRRS